METHNASQVVIVAIRAIFERWTALRLVIEHQCGGIAFEADQMLDTTVAMATHPSKRHDIDDYTSLFYATFEKFDADVEDGSPEEVAALILAIRDGAAVGNFEPARSAAEKAGMSADAFKASVEGRQDSDDEENDPDYIPCRDMDYEPPRTRSMAVVDEDGFTQVAPRRKR